MLLLFCLFWYQRLLEDYNLGGYYYFCRNTPLFLGEIFFIFNIPTNLLSSSGFCIPSASSSHVYYFVNKKMTWSDAQDYCIDHHTDLAEIYDKENQTTMMNSAAGGYKYKAWIGLSRKLIFRWVDGKKVTFTNWHIGEPHIVNTIEVCVVLTKDGYWRDNRCTLLRHPLCIRGG